MAKHIQGVDHCYLLVRDLEAAGRTFERLGFTVAPRSLHSEFLGTGNHCIIFENDYIELMGVVKPTERNARQRRRLEKGEGLGGIALATGDARAAYEELEGLGLAPRAPVDFSRPVDVPGVTGEAAFTVTHLPLERELGCARFLCEHKTRELVWRPEWQDHPNGAVRLSKLVIAVAEPERSAEHFARIFGASNVETDKGQATIETGGAEIALIRADEVARFYPASVVPESIEPPQPVAIHISVEDRGAVAAFLKDRGVPTVESGERLVTPHEHACGAAIVWV